MVPEGEVYNILNDFKLTLKTVETSLTEIGHQFGDKFGEHQILLDSIKAINDRSAFIFWTFLDVLGYQKNVTYLLVKTPRLWVIVIRLNLEATI